MFTKEKKLLIFFATFGVLSFAYTATEVIEEEFVVTPEITDQVSETELIVTDVEEKEESVIIPEVSEEEFVVAPEVTEETPKKNSVYVKLTKEEKDDAFGSASACFVSSNKFAPSYFVYTVDVNGLFVTVLECYKKNDLANPNPIRYKRFDALQMVRTDEKYRGARYNSKFLTGLEKLSENSNSANRDLIEVLDTGYDYYRSIEDITSDEETLNSTQKILTWYHKHFHYMKEFTGCPFVDEYKKYPVIQWKLVSVEQLRGLLSNLSLNLDEKPKVKPVLILQVEDDKDLSTLTDEDKTLIHEYFRPVHPADKEVTTYLFKCAKVMNQIRKNPAKTMPLIDRSYVQKVMDRVEGMFEEFDTDRLIPETVKWIVVGVAVIYGKTFLAHVAKTLRGK